ncbi:hypothetical protein V6Z11_D06G169000 [Gossypium hirsutum]
MRHWVPNWSVGWICGSVRIRVVLMGLGTFQLTINSASNLNPELKLGTFQLTINSASNLNPELKCGDISFCNCM